MKDRELSIERILELDQALVMSSQIDDLPSGLTTMRLGKLSEEISPFINSLNKAKESKRKQILKKQMALDKKVAGWQQEHELLNMAFHEEIQVLIDEANKNKKGKKIKCPEFKLEDFIAKEDFTRTISVSQGQTKDIAIKKGQALLPPLFFALMADLISE